MMAVLNGSSCNQADEGKILSPPELFFIFLLPNIFFKLEIERKILFVSLTQADPPSLPGGKAVYLQGTKKGNHR
jgi:hypothetical protein